MDNIQKFLADAQRIKKHYRAEHQNYDGIKVCEQIRDHFEKINRAAPGLAQSFGQYWLDSYIYKSRDPANEPSDQNLGKITALLALLESGDATSQDLEALDAADWKEIKDLVNYEAGDLPIDLLNDLMMVIVGKVSFD